MQCSQLRHCISLPFQRQNLIGITSLNFLSNFWWLFLKMASLNRAIFKPRNWKCCCYCSFDNLCSVSTSALHGLWRSDLKCNFLLLQATWHHRHQGHIASSLARWQGPVHSLGRKDKGMWKNCLVTFCELWLTNICSCHGRCRSVNTLLTW